MTKGDVAGWEGGINSAHKFQCPHPQFFLSENFM